MTVTARRILPSGCVRLGHCAISEEISDKSTAPQSLAERAAALSRDREAEEERAAQEVERLHAEELERRHEAEVHWERGLGHEL